MAKQSVYHQTLASLADWDPYLLAESGLPGPRGNLELVQAAADLGTPAQFRRWLALDAAAAPTNTPAEFLPVCGAVGLGRLLAAGDRAVLPELRRHASDPRWRLREGVAMALQHWGDADMSALITAMKPWSRGNWLEQRAAAAALCEPRLLANPAHTLRVLSILDTITTALINATAVERKDPNYRVLRQALGYCWSVAVAAAPEPGKAALEKWLKQAASDPDLRWMLLENLKKNRLHRADPTWVARWQAQMLTFQSPT
ncbi:MAG: hypothetical protein ABI847_15595 [Anaerolineales bacterium]